MTLLICVEFVVGDSGSGEWDGEFVSECVSYRLW